MKIKLTMAPIVLLLTSAIVVGRAQATDWSVVVDLGQADIDYFVSNVDGFVRLDDDSPVWSIQLGYRLTPFLSLETGYRDLGEYSGSGFFCPPPAVCIAGVLPIQGDLDALHVRLVPEWEIGQQISLIGQIGLMRWNLDVVKPGQKRITEVAYGLGARYRVDEHWSLQTVYEIAGDLDSLSVGLRWVF